MRLGIDDAQTIYGSSVNGEITILAGAGVENHIQLTISSAVTATFQFERAYADFEIVDASGEVVESIRINFQLMKEVTRWVALLLSRLIKRVTIYKFTQNHLGDTNSQGVKSADFFATTT